MSWPSVPSVWHTPTVQAGAAQAPAVNMGMYQQYALQQQSWEQWQIYQTQFAQWQTQYGEQYQQMQNQNINTQNMGGFVAPPPLPDYQPPPPPPPVQTMQPSVQSMQTSEMPIIAQSHNLQQPPPTVQSMGSEQQSDGSLKMNEPPTANINQTQTSVSALSQDKNLNFDQSNSQYNQDGFRRNNRNSRWGNDNSNNSGNNNRNNRMSGGHTNFNNRNSSSYDDYAPDDHDHVEEKEEKSQEEINFDIQYQKWEDRLAEWKRNNANHPDRNQYNDFLTKMEVCREQLLQRRESIRQKRLDRNAQLAQNLQNQNPSPQAMNKNESPAECLDQDQENVNQVSTTATNDFGSDEPIASGLFSSERGDSNAAIPGLDLVSGDDKPSQVGGGDAGPPPLFNEPPPKCESTKPESDSNIVARVTNILGNPEIQSLLSNIQKQKIETATLQSNIQTRDSNENDGQSGVNVFNRSDNFGHFDKQQNTDEPERNPFRHNTRGDVDTRNSSEFEMNAKRGRYDFENTMNNRPEFDRFDRFNRFDRDRNDPFTQQSTNQDFDGRDFGQKSRWSKEFDTFNSPNNSNFNNMPIDFDEFRPIQVIDYQNKTSIPLPFVNPSSFSKITPQNVRKYEEVFHRKVIEYDHKSKVHPWNWFCPVIQMEYNHTKNGLSLHEHPPPKSIRPEPVQRIHPELDHRMKQEFAKRDHFPLKHQKWQQNERTERVYQGDRYHQPRFESRQLPNDMQSYSRRNPQERNWSRNYQEWNTQQGNYGYNRPVESRSNVSNFSGKDDANTLANAPTTQPPVQRNVVVKEQQRTKFNLKNLLFHPGRSIRPKKIVIIMRGVPGSGKSFISKMIKEKESEMQGSVRILSIDDYFMVDNDEYEYEASMEESYTQYLLKAFKKTLMDNLYQFVIIDCNNITLNHLNEFHTIATSCLFTPYICELPLDLEKCLKNNIHNRSEGDIRRAINEWAPTPFAYTVLDYSCLFNNADDTEEISDTEEDKEGKVEYLDAVSDEDKHNDDEFSDTEGDDTLINEFGIFKSKWDNDTTENKLARLDGTNKPMKHTTIEDYLQMDGWEPPPTSRDGKKRVRWADIEQKREQDKQRAIGFIVGQTDWKNLIDEPRDHSNALTAVKYIEKVRKT